MWYLYLDESGDLGFNLEDKKSSKFFTITILAISNGFKNKAITNAAEKTIKRKFNKNRIQPIELKGTKTSLDVKKYFYRQLKNVNFGLFSITLNKKRVYEYLTKKKSHVYNYICRLVLDQIPFKLAAESSAERVYLIIDKSKSKPQIKEFNTYIIEQLKARLDPQIPLDIFHYKSIQNKGLQVVDMFSWGIFRKYERQDESWYNIFKAKIRYDTVYLP